MPIRCLVVDDHTLFRAGLRRLLEAEDDFAVIGEAGGAAEALEKAHEENLYMQVLKTGAASEETSRTRAETISGLAEHDIYHLGQIAMLKKALRMKK